MEIYFYCEFNGCKNSGIPVFFGESHEFLDIIKENSGAAAAAGITPGDFSETTICLGYFDGVHLAHRALFERAKKHGRWGVLLFDRNTKDVPLLTTQYEKIKILSELGADYAIIAEFSEKFMQRTPEEFADFLKDTLKVSRVVAGYDYRFGCKASGDSDMLSRLCQDRGILVEIAEPECDGGEPIKSTKIRKYIESGNIPSANHLLGYAYTVSGVVEKGFGNGRKMGFPTANVAYNFEKLLPPDGVYRGSVLGKSAVINIGKNPTFDAKERTLEVHLVDFDGDLYDEQIDVQLYEKLRDDIKFETVDELIKQIEQDIEKVRKNYGKKNFNGNDL
ncbi:MAG: riboflavin biosynthesis protein RibF [Clostridia bacterium]|nr:riboflavin biosynthesis protein RibF [Clostridia bacterium]